MREPVFGKSVPSDLTGGDHAQATSLSGMMIRGKVISFQPVWFDGGSAVNVDRRT
jgi:hypothetical protein